MPGTQPGSVGKFSVVLIVLIFDINNQIKVTTENKRLHSLAVFLACVEIFLSKFVVFVKNDTKLNLTMPTLITTYNQTLGIFLYFM